MKSTYAQKTGRLVSCSCEDLTDFSPDRSSKTPRTNKAGRVGSCSCEDLTGFFFSCQVWKNTAYEQGREGVLLVVVIGFCAAPTVL